MTTIKKIYDLDGVKMSKEEVEQWAEDNGAGIETDLSEAEELTAMDIVNPENSQHSIYAVVATEDAGYEEARRELSLTNQYYNWSGTIADRISSQLWEEGELVEKVELSEKDIEEYNDQVGGFNQYGDAEKIKAKMTAEQIADVLLGNANQIR